MKQLIPMVAVAASCFASGMPQAFSAQPYPTKSIRMLVGFPVGGGADVAARILGQPMSEALGQQIIVDNRPGAGSAIASELAAKALPDGYTLIMIGSSHAVNAGLHKKLPYEPIKDYAAIVLVASAPVVLTANLKMPANNLKELIALAKAQPGKLNYASAGVGGINHLAGELLKKNAGVDITHVPYKGVAQALPPVIAGEVQLMYSSLPGALTQIKANRIKAIAVTSAKRVSAAPDIPTVAESGLPGYEATSWYGMLAPAATPRPVINRLHAETMTALQKPAVREALIRQGAEPQGSTPAEFSAYLKSEVAKWTRLVQEAGIKPE